MTTRNLTDSFIFMRNNAVQNRQYYNDDSSSDKTQLINRDVESNIGDREDLPAEYKSLVNNIQFDFSRVQQKMKLLISLHDKHLNRASLDDNLDEDREIEEKTKDLTSNFMEVHRKLSQLSSAGRSLRMSGGAKENIASNIQSNIARQLMDLSVTFRKAQSQYLSKLKSRDDRLKGFFEIPPDSTMNVNGDFVDDSDGLPDFYQRQTNRQQQMVEENSQAVLEREKEISEIVRSIQELNGIFRDLSQLVTDQGSVIDRIDHNVEQTQIRVREGLGQLQKAHKYQRKNRKILIIVVLGIIATIMALFLVFTKLR